MNQISTTPNQVVVPSSHQTLGALHDPAWIAARTALEKDFPYGCGRPSRYWFFGVLEGALRASLKVSGLYGRGKRNALNLRLREIELPFPNLPEAFDGFRILQVSDLHFGGLDGLDELVLDLVGRVEADIGVLTGDYIGHCNNGLHVFSKALGRLTDAMNIQDRTFAILGNHDSIRMAGTFHDHGIDLLGNRSIRLMRGDDTVHLTGIDDVYLFRTPLAEAAMARKPDGFNILLAHSPHAAFEASAAGFDLYLTGHTHGGQICLPGGRPLVTAVGGPRSFNAGLWRHGRMTGYTNSGAGVSQVPVRFNTRGEIALITLRVPHPV